MQQIKIRFQILTYCSKNDIVKTSRLNQLFSNEWKLGFFGTELHLNTEDPSRKAMMMNKCTSDFSFFSVGHDLIRASFNGLSFLSCFF